MNTSEVAKLAAELRKAAQDLLLCVNTIVGQEQSLAAGAAGVAGLAHGPAPRARSAAGVAAVECAR